MKDFKGYYNEADTSSPTLKDWEMRTFDEVFDNILSQSELAIEYLQEGEHARVKESIEDIVLKVVEVQTNFRKLFKNGQYR